VRDGNIFPIAIGIRSQTTLLSEVR